MMRVGILAVQGAFREHRTMLDSLGVETREVRLPEHLEGIQGLIIPGGESTTIGKLCHEYNLLEPLRAFGADNPIWGTCAGAIFLSRQAFQDQHLLGLMDIEVDRNAFGRQVDSFETDLQVDGLADPDHPFPGIFIRAPIIRSVGDSVTVLSRVDLDRGPSGIVAAQQGRLLATVFHPELTNDLRFHQYFVQLIEKGID